MSAELVYDISKKNPRRDNYNTRSGMDKITAFLQARHVQLEGNADFVISGCV